VTASTLPLAPATTTVAGTGPTPRPGPGPPPPPALATAEVAAARRRVRSPDYPPVQAGQNTAPLRRAELLGLTWPMVDLNRGTLRVAQGVQRVAAAWSSTS
jgi:hypothetical protein